MPQLETIISSRVLRISEGVSVINEPAPAGPKDAAGAHAQAPLGFSWAEIRGRVPT